jgi:hypothetical protein
MLDGKWSRASLPYNTHHFFLRKEEEERMAQPKG